MDNTPKGWPGKKEYENALFIKRVLKLNGKDFESLRLLAYEYESLPEDTDFNDWLVKNAQNNGIPGKALRIYVETLWAEQSYQDEVWKSMLIAAAAFFKKD